ncbi:hypothetical protein [Nonomuraea sp. GTA35]|uniref:hypothetical protein n=1 Tax=Nonomuraea sp. GTA35 TaxID=1676746 RepID=UPI0035C05264
MLYFDDQFPIHRKVTRLSDAAFRLHVSAIFWCGRNLTDGAIPEEDLEDVSAQVRTPARFVPELLKRGLWHEAGQSCASEACPAPAPEGAWVIHDYFDYQPTKVKAVKKRKDNAERQRRWRERQREPESRSRNNGVSNASRNALLTQPSPVPSSPEGTRTDTGSQSSSRRNAPAWAEDDDSIDLGIVELLAELTSHQISILDAAAIRQRILGTRQIRTSRAAYVAAAIVDNPSKFLPVVETEFSDRAKSLRAVPEWCGLCESDTYRWLVLADGRWAKCPACNPDAKDPFASKEVS